jgi:predicted nicotinamide N-methyase
LLETGLSAWTCSAVRPTSAKLTAISSTPNGMAIQGGHEAQADGTRICRASTVQRPGTGNRTDAGRGPRDERLLAAWRRRLERRRRVLDLPLSIRGAARTYSITVPADPDAVLDELVAPEPHMPYWATPWASGLALAELALERRGRVCGARALELGCGLGITATAAAEAGLELTATDCFAEALAYARYNALRNTGRRVRTLLVDWRTDAGRDALAALERVGLVLAADVLYEVEDIAPLMALFAAFLERGAEVWLAEPGRATSARFVELAGATWRLETEEIERVWPAAAGYAKVRLHTIRGR